MLHAAVGNFLESVSEREFDPTLLALLAAQGFYDVRFIHGAFEFGKDVIAKRRDPATGTTYQYAIQSKAGDLGQSEWRAVRPQLEEAEYNTRAHPSFDADLPRVAVLLTTGRLKGAAAVDAQEYAQARAARGAARVEVWDREDLSAWLIANPNVAILSVSEQQELLHMLTDIQARRVDEPALERFTRRWMQPGMMGLAGIEAAILIHALREHARLDLAAMCALHLFRGARVRDADAQAESARRLFHAVCALLLEAVQPMLDEPTAITRGDSSPTGLVSYAVTAVRATELLALAALSTQEPAGGEAFEEAVMVLAGLHPGAHRPVSDQFAVSLIPIVCVVHRRDPEAAAQYLRAAATWLMQRTDPTLNGLGLGTMDESPRDVVDRLLGGCLTATSLSPSRASYVLTVILDLCLATSHVDLFDAVLSNARNLQMTPCTTKVASGENFRRAGGGVIPVPRMEFKDHVLAYPALPTSSGWSSSDTTLLVASCRSRHYTDAIRQQLVGTRSAEG